MDDAHNAGSSGAEGQAGPVTFRPIGVVHTPYRDWAPYAPPDREVPPERFYVELDPEYEDGLYRLETFSHVWLITALVARDRAVSLRVVPPWTGQEISVGLFATRSPDRPCPIGLTVAPLLARQGRRLYTGPLDLFDGTPLLDLKPYLPDLDARPLANSGWIDALPGRDHLMDHLLGRPHEHGHGEGDDGHGHHGHGHHDHGGHSHHDDSGQSGHRH